MINFFSHSQVGFKLGLVMLMTALAFSSSAQFLASDCITDADNDGWLYDLDDCTPLDSFMLNTPIEWDDILCDTCDFIYVVGDECCKDTSYHEWIFEGCPDCECVPTLTLDDPDCPEYILVDMSSCAFNCNVNFVYDNSGTTAFIFSSTSGAVRRYYPNTGDITDDSGNLLFNTTAHGNGDYYFIVNTCDSCDDFVSDPLNFVYGVCDCLPDLNIAFSGDNTDSCDDLQFTASGGAGAPYTWSSLTTGSLIESIDASGFINSHNEGVPSGTSPSGTYEVTVTDSGGCTASTSIAYDKCDIYPSGQILDMCNASVQNVDCVTSTVLIEVYHNHWQNPCWPFYTMQNVTINGVSWSMVQDPSFPVMNGTCSTTNPSGGVCPVSAFTITGFLQIPHDNSIACTTCILEFDLYGDNIFMGNYTLPLIDPITTCP